jgi:hypothetical protein
VFQEELHIPAAFRPRDHPWPRLYAMKRMVLIMFSLAPKLE